ncbi:hypothetical protein HETIRDRAFT_427702 [Heterobasidion irregulare TC 32-1]|uniref:CCHC-type domain-containing protein n=1 Tax=Heterobasidion irregulare (strain TC 32-1) TaxID=747525 RepID=W4K4R4_HETIT|nr:uncharacterized protein HETIRDRAFT_427702 [Heterobasidion irregulare TC 32-1]ETW80787.1 hypothetical protein HETIRDRAFT_427702 [Heterobasidion irregulare TC 32-1]
MSRKGRNTLADSWTSTPTFKEFCEKVYKLYPGSEEEHKWSVLDMDKLVGKMSRVSILSLSELDDPYNLQDIHDAAQFVLHGTTSAYSTMSTDISRAAPAAPPTNAIKAEDLATMFEWLTDTFIKAIATQRTSRPADRPSRQPGQGGNNCMFCGSPEHFMHACPEVTEYIQIVKCKRNIEGKVESRTVGDWTDDVYGKRGANSPDDDSLPSQFTLIAGCHPDLPTHRRPVNHKPQTQTIHTPNMGREGMQNGTDRTFGAYPITGS